MPTIDGIGFPDIVTGKTPGASLLKVFTSGGEDLTLTYHLCQFNFLTGHAIVALRHPDGRIQMANGKPVYKALIVQNPKFSIDGQKRVTLR